MSENNDSCDDNAPNMFQLGQYDHFPFNFLMKTFAFYPYQIAGYHLIGIIQLDIRWPWHCNSFSFLMLHLLVFAFLHVQLERL